MQAQKKQLVEKASEKLFETKNRLKSLNYIEIRLNFGKKPMMVGNFRNIKYQKQNRIIANKDMKMSALTCLIRSKLANQEDKKVSYNLTHKNKIISEAEYSTLRSFIQKVGEAQIEAASGVIQFNVVTMQSF